MAPEIKENKPYDGRQVDIFSAGVILFILVLGIFPFQEARKDDYFYNLVLTGKLSTYWKKVGGEQLAPEFKDLILKMLSYDANKRPTIEELKAHPWFNKPYNVKETRSRIQEKFHEKLSCETSATDSATEWTVNDMKVNDFYLYDIRLYHNSSEFELQKDISKFTVNCR